MQEYEMVIKKCPICGTDVTFAKFGSMPRIKCDRCGLFDFNPVLFATDRSSWLRHKHLIAGYMCETKRRRESNLLTESSNILDFGIDSIQKILSSPLIPKTSMQKLDKILLNLYKSGEGFTIEFDSGELFPAIGYARNREELENMLLALCELGYIKNTSNIAGGKEYAITIKGLERAETLLTEQNFSKKAFIAMRFSDDLKAVRDESMKPACEACGFEAYTVDEEEHIGDITDKIISGIKTSRFVIADFTYNNPGVYYEAGYAKGLGIPVIKTCKKEWFDSLDKNDPANRLHFDVEHDNMILWENAEHLRQRLESRIRAVIL